jgi:hypothetical protein
MVSPLLRGFVLCVEQRCSESASKKLQNILCPSPLNPII